MISLTTFGSSAAAMKLAAAANEGKLDALAVKKIQRYLVEHRNFIRDVRASLLAGIIRRETFVAIMKMYHDDLWDRQHHLTGDIGAMNSYLYNVVIGEVRAMINSAPK